MNGKFTFKTLPDGSVDRTKVICTYCRHEMSYHWSTSSLRYHLQAKHMADAESPPPPTMFWSHLGWGDICWAFYFPAWVLNKYFHKASIFAISYVVKSIKNMKKIHQGTFRTERNVINHELTMDKMRLIAIKKPYRLTALIIRQTLYWCHRQE